MTTANASTQSSPPSNDQLSIDGRTAIIAGAIATIIFVGTFFDWFRSQVRNAIASPSDWGHTLLIPVIAGWFVWMKKDRLMALPIRPAWSGLAIVVFGMVAYMVCTLGPAGLQHHNIRSVGIALALYGFVLLIFGWGWMRWLWFAIAYMVVFGQYVSERFISIVTYQLQDISAKGAYLFLSVLGMDVDLTGNVLTVHSGGAAITLNIAEACSGMRMLVAFLALGVAMAYVSLPTLWQRVTLVVMGVPVAVFVNVLRVVSLGFLSMYDSEFAAGEFHHFIGLLWLLPAFSLYLLVLWILTNMVVQQPDGAGVKRAS